MMRQGGHHVGAAKRGNAANGGSKVKLDANGGAPCPRPGLAKWAAVLCLAAGLGLMSPVSASAQSGPRLAAGEDAWDKAGCFECHGAAGEGGDGRRIPGRSEPAREPGSTGRRWWRPSAAAASGHADAGVARRRLHEALRATACRRAGARRKSTLIPVLDAGEIQALVDYLMAKIVGIGEPASIVRFSHGAPDPRRSSACAPSSRIGSRSCRPVLGSSDACPDL